MKQMYVSPLPAQAGMGQPDMAWVTYVTTPARMAVRIA